MTKQFGQHHLKDCGTNVPISDGIKIEPFEPQSGIENILGKFIVLLLPLQRYKTLSLFEDYVSGLFQNLSFPTPADSTTCRYV